MSIYLYIYIYILLLYYYMFIILPGVLWTRSAAAAFALAARSGVCSGVRPSIASADHAEQPRPHLQAFTCLNR